MHRPIKNREDEEELGEDEYRDLKEEDARRRAERRPSEDEKDHRHAIRTNDPGHICGEDE